LNRENNNVGESALAMPDVVWPIWERLVGKEECRAATSDEIVTLTGNMARGDEAAFREFYDRYFNRLYGYLLVVSRGREDLAREALQNTMLRVVRHVRKFDDENKFWSWLAVLARSAFVDEQRKRARYAGLLDRFFKASPAVGNDSKEAEAHLQACLAEGLNRLASDERDLIQRKYFRRESMNEIAQALDVTAKAVESRLTRVRQRLKENILTLLNDEAK
jgi:RNA polymerase sigma-70 factor (ECF subfamily)